MMLSIRVTFAQGQRGFLRVVRQKPFQQLHLCSRACDGNFSRSWGTDIPETSPKCFSNLGLSLFIINSCSHVKIEMTGRSPTNIGDLIKEALKP